MSKHITGLDHIGIYTNNRDLSVEFYKNLLGFEVVFTVDNENNSGLLITVVKKGSCTLELLEPVTADENIVPSATSSMNHIAVACRDIQSLVGELKAKGIKFETEETAYVEGFGRPDTDIEIIFTRGPAGERIELYETFDHGTQG
jgi:catechol 2,3-dioxygenase-like lactoylglutathione lyase family enzyme